MRVINTNPTYQEIDRACALLVGQIIAVSKATPRVIVGLTRGGLVPAVIMSHMFSTLSGKTRMVPISYSSTKGKGEFREYSNVLLPLPDVNVLIVDDICDSGNTLLEVSTYYKNAGYLVQTAAIHYKEGAIYTPDYFAWHLAKDSPWIIYPWEVG